MEFHPAANIFPMLTGEEYIALRDDISVNGLLESIDIYEGKVLDGRNRYTACLDIGIEPVISEYTGDDPLGYVISKNLKRRHLTSSQRAVVALDYEKLLAEEAKKNQQAAGKYNRNPDQDQLFETFQKADAEPIHAAQQAAKLLGTNMHYVIDAKRIGREEPEILEQVRTGDMTIPQAKKKIKEQKRKNDIEEQREAIATGEIKPTGKYDVIVIDPPWPYGTKYDADGRRAANPYPEMSLDDIAGIELPAADDCVLWLWTTHKFMRYSFDILDKWGFRDVSILTWIKDRMGLGTWLRSQSEFCIMAVKGKPIIDLTNQTSILISDKLREHSRKPDAFYEMVNTLCVGFKVDYFSREKREGWEQFGNDVSKFDME